MFAYFLKDTTRIEQRFENFVRHLSDFMHDRVIGLLSQIKLKPELHGKFPCQILIKKITFPHCERYHYTTK